MQLGRLWKKLCILLFIENFIHKSPLTSHMTCHVMMWWVMWRVMWRSCDAAVWQSRVQETFDLSGRGVGLQLMENGYRFVLGAIAGGEGAPHPHPPTSHATHTTPHRTAPHHTHTPPTPTHTALHRTTPTPHPHPAPHWRTGTTSPWGQSQEVRGHPTHAAPTFHPHPTPHCAPHPTTPHPSLSGATVTPILHDLFPLSPVVR